MELKWVRFVIVKEVAGNDGFLLVSVSKGPIEPLTLNFAETYCDCCHNVTFITVLMEFLLYY